MHTSEELEKMAVDLLIAVWRDIDPDYKSKYRRDIWRMFQDAVYISANQSVKLPVFVGKLSDRVRAGLGRNEKYRTNVIHVLQSGMDYELLHLYRTETAWLVLLVQDEMKGIKEQFEDEYKLS